MIKINKNDTIVDILTKVSESKQEKIVLEFPFGHPVLHNYLSLKIIQNKVGKKNLLILTNDKTSQKIGKTLGIKYSKNSNEISPKSGESMQQMLRENYTFTQYAIYEIKRILGLVKGNIVQNKKINSLQYYTNKHKHINKNIIIMFLFSFIFISLILLYIFYFAINNTVIHITPEKNVYSQARNFIYEEYSESIIDQSLSTKNTIPLTPIIKHINIEKKITTSGVIQDGENTAEGEATFYNYLPEEINLLAFTQLENQEGIQFETKQPIYIPSSTTDESGKIIPGETTVTIYGKIKLINGDYSGEKANILAGVSLIIPKLEDDIKDKIFAKTVTDFTGGSNDFIKVLTQEDIDNGIILLKEILQQEAINEVIAEVSNQNINNNVKLEILPADNVFKFTNESIIVPDHLTPGDQIEDFTITGNIDIKTYVYNKDSLVSKLTQLINNMTISDLEEVSHIDTGSLRISHIISRNDLILKSGKYTYLQDLEGKMFTLKGTTQIEYYVTKNFNNKDNNYINTLKHEISGMEVEKAVSILTNNRDINSVSISVQPFFLKKISLTPDNIIFKVTD